MWRIYQHRQHKGYVFMPSVQELTLSKWQIVASYASRQEAESFYHQVLDNQSIIK